MKAKTSTHSMPLPFLVGLSLVLSAQPARAATPTTIPLGTATGGVAIYYNNNGMGEQPSNQAYLRAQFSQMNTNGAEFNFDSTPLPGTNGTTSFFDLFQAVPNQFGVDLVLKAPTFDGSVALPSLHARDNVDGNVAHAADGGPVTWAIDSYTGPSDGPSNPADAVINSVFRGGTGANDGVIITTNTLSQSGTVFTVHIAGELDSDNLVHWYTPSTPNSPVANLQLTGKLYFDGVLSYDSAGDLGTDLIDFYSGTITLSAGVICGTRFVATTGNDFPGGQPNYCRTAGTPCKTIQRTVSLSCPGDTVSLAAGTYKENVEIDRPLTVLGAGKTLTTIEPAVSGPNPPSCGSLCAGASSVILVEADDVTIHDLAVDGDNPSLTSGVTAGGADLDARNGIITNHQIGTFNDLTVFNVAVRNIYLRGIYASSGGTFNFHDNMVQNVQADPSSVAMFNFGGSGTFANNMVSTSNDAISSNHSSGTQFLNNVITTSGSGVHTDNAGDGGGTADLIQGNQVSDCTAGGYGFFVFVPYIAPSFQNNTVSNCSVGLAAFGTGNPVTSTFSGNTVDGKNLAGSTGVYVTTDQVGFGDGNVSASFSNNEITGNAEAVFVEQHTGFTASATFNCNRITDNSKGFTSQSASVVAHDNSIERNGVGADGTAITSGTMNAESNYWGCPGGPGNVGCDTVVGNVDAFPASGAAATCVPATEDLNLTRVKLKRNTGTTKPNGLIRVDGDFVTHPPTDTLDPVSQGVAVRIQDSFGTVVTHTWVAGSGECKLPSKSGIYKCVSTDRQATIQFRALVKPPLNTTANQAYKLQVILKRLSISSPFAGPVTVTVTEIGPGVERQDSIMDCSSTVIAMTCHES